MKLSIAIRMATMFALAALAAFTLISVGLYSVLQRELQRQQTDVLNAAANDISYSMLHMGEAQRWGRLRAKLDTLATSDVNLKFWVEGPDPRFVYGGPLPAGASIANGLGRVSLPDHDYPLLTLTRTIKPVGERPEVKLVVGIDSTPYFHTLHTFLVALAALLLLAVVAIVMLGGWIAQAGLRPLRRLSDEAQQLSPRNLSQRLHSDDLPVELGALGAAFNGALGRLEAAYKQLEAFNADVAHELRTPLTNLIGQTQVALSRRRDAQDLEEVLQSNLEDLDQLRAIVNDMLFLARADQGEVADARERVAVADEICKTIEFFEFVLDDLGLAVVIEGDQQALAPIDRAQFRRAMSNLLQNAIQHTRGGKLIVVDIRHQQDGTVRIAVTNPGEAIDPRHLPRLFDRFYRIDPARRDSDANRGHGLGLAIVKAVANMHGGSVFASSDGGATSVGFSVRT